MRRMILFCSLCLTSTAAVLAQGAASSLPGTWEGPLDVPGGVVRIVFHITAAPGGSLRATLDSPDQDAYGVPMDTVAVRGSGVRLELRGADVVFEGDLYGDGLTLQGHWKQRGAVLPLTLKRVASAPSAATPRRPQEPAPPLPYGVDAVTFPNDDAGVVLAGTLTLPPGAGPHPAVVLLSGSGPSDRDETIAGHRPFLVLADYLTRRGLAVLRYDDRGVGESEGDHVAATSEDFAADALAAVSFLQAHARIDPDRIGLLGHSEGGYVAPMAANRSDAVAFVVLLAGQGLPGDEVSMAQAQAIYTASGLPEATIAAARVQQERLFAIVRSEPDDSLAARRLRTLLRRDLDARTEAEKAAQGLSDVDVAQWIELQVERLISPWMRFFLFYDPRPALRALDVPVLALFGEKDLQVTPADNRPAVQAALDAGGVADATVVELPGLNHLFQTARTGLPTEYGTIEETLSPAALQVIGDWIVARTTAAEDDP